MKMFLHEAQCHLVCVVHSTVCSQISFGGLPVSAKPSSGGRENFVGCMEGITYNRDNITNLVRRKKVDTSSFVRQFSLAPSVCVCVYNRHMAYIVSFDMSLSVRDQTHQMQTSTLLLVRNEQNKPGSRQRDTYPRGEWTVQRTCRRS